MHRVKQTRFFFLKPEENNFFFRVPFYKDKNAEEAGEGYMLTFLILIFLEN